MSVFMEKIKAIGAKAFFPIALLLLVSVIYSLVTTQQGINAKKQEIAAVQTQIASQEEQNEEINRELSGTDSEIIERAARDELDYARPNERIFVDISGK